MENKGQLTVTVECKMDDIEAMIKEIKELPTFGTDAPGLEDKIFVERDALVEIFKRHLKAEVKK